MSPMDRSPSDPDSRASGEDGERTARPATRLCRRGKVVLIEACDEDAHATIQLLEANGYEVCWSKALSEVSARLTDPEVDLLVLEPGPSGAAGNPLTHLDTFAAPILVLSRWAETIDRVHALDGGADGFIAKTAHPREILAQVGVMMRRAQKTSDPPWSAGVETYRYDSPRAIFSGPTGRALLAPADGVLLVYLARNAGRICSREELSGALIRAHRGRAPPPIDAVVRRLKDRIASLGPPANDMLLALRSGGCRLAARSRLAGAGEWILEIDRI